MKLELTACPVCGCSINKIREDWDGSFKNQKYVVPDLEYYRCKNCGEEVYPREAMQKNEACSPAFRTLTSAE